MGAILTTLMASKAARLAAEIAVGLALVFTILSLAYCHGRSDVRKAVQVEQVQVKVKALQKEAEISKASIAATDEHLHFVDILVQEKEKAHAEVNAQMGATQLVPVDVGRAWVDALTGLRDAADRADDAEDPAATTAS